MKLLKRLLAACLCFGMLASMLVMPAVAKEENMFTNGDFENAINGWQSWSSDPEAGEVFISPDGGVDGSACVMITNSKPVPTSLFQNVPCKKGVKYLLTCDIRYENVSSDNGGLGACVGTSFYNAAGENVKEGLSTPYYGTSDWRTISYAFELDEDPARFSIGPRLWVSTGTVYVDNIELRAISDESAKSGTYDLTLADAANRHTVNALGAEWDPKLLLPVNQKHGVTEDDLDFMKGRMEALGLQAVRMMITPDWFEKENDNADPKVADPKGFDFDNDEMKSVFAYLKVCEELGVRVTLTWWGAPTGHWLACKNTGDWIGAPNDLDEMAENIAYLLGYIRNDLKLTCVKELILQNEPSYSFKVNGGAVDFEYYVDYYKTVRDRLKADGMEDIVLVGADDSQHYGWYYESVGALSDICGKFNSHNYAWAYDTPYLDVMVQEFVSARTSISGDRPFFLGEFGDGTTSGAYTAASTETFGRGIYVASVVVNAFKAGAAGASYWPLHDIYYYENTQGGDNGGLMAQGLIGFKKDGQWSFRPTYYAYGLLCNYIPFGSEIYNVVGDTDHYVDTVAVKTAEGRWSIIAVNRSDAEQTLNIAASAIGSNLNRYAYVDGALPTDGSMIAAGEKVAPVDGKYTVKLPATSMVVLSNIDMSEADMTEGLPTTGETESDTDTDAHTDAVTDPAASDTTAPAASDTDASTSTATVGGADATDDGCASAATIGASIALATAAALVLRKRRKTDD